jgi:hypothetical protein
MDATSRTAKGGLKMLKIEKTVLPSPEQWEIIIEGMRNPMNSWDKMDSDTCGNRLVNCEKYTHCHVEYCIGDNDHKLMTQLAKGGAVHAKYRRMIPVFLTIDAPLYWWKEFDTYKVGTVANSCSTMHKIQSKEFTLDDFSIDHLYGLKEYRDVDEPIGIMNIVIDMLNYQRESFLETKDKIFWWQMIQLLPTSYNQKRTVMLNYEVLVNIYHSRKNHKLDEWHVFCDWIRKLPYSELITGDAED